MALPVLSRATAERTRPMVSAIITAAPAPCTARAAISIGRAGEIPLSSDAAVKTAMPASITRR